MRKPFLPDELSRPWWYVFVRYLGCVPYLNKTQKILISEQALITLGNARPDLVPAIQAYIMGADTGDPSHVAVELCKNDIVDRHWAMHIVTRARIGDPARAAASLLSYYARKKKLHDVQEVLPWAQHVIESARCGDPPIAASWLSECLPINDKLLDWIRKCIASARCGDPARAAYSLNCRNDAKHRQWMTHVVETATTGNPAAIAAYIAGKYENKIDWARSVIERARTGDPSDAAVHLNRYHRDDDWIKRIIENDVCGNPAYAAVCVAYLFGNDWAKKIIESAQTGDPAKAAVWLYRNEGVKTDWVTSVIENTPIGDPPAAANNLCYDVGELLVPWGLKVIESAKIGTPATAAADIAFNNRRLLNWAKSVINNAYGSDAADGAFLLAYKYKSLRGWARSVAERVYCQ